MIEVGDDIGDDEGEDQDGHGAAKPDGSAVALFPSDVSRTRTSLYFFRAHENAVHGIALFWKLAVFCCDAEVQIFDGELCELRSAPCHTGRT